jgi:hypothetical protein
MKRIYNLLVLCFVGVPCVLAQQAQQGAADDTDTLVKQTTEPCCQSDQRTLPEQSQLPHWSLR